MKKIVFLTGAGISAESGIRTFRDAGGLWEEYSIEDVCSVEGWHRNPKLVNAFYQERRRQLAGAKPNEAHRRVAQLEQDFQVVVVTQNVDDLHERAGSSTIIHLHGELLTMCSSFNKEDLAQHVHLSLDNVEVPADARAADGSLLRPYIVWFGENVPKLEDAIDEIQSADIVVIIGTSLNVYPAAGLINYARPDAQLFLIDPNPVKLPRNLTVSVIQQTASQGMQTLCEHLSSLKL